MSLIVDNLLASERIQSTMRIAVGLSRLLVSGSAMLAMLMSCGGCHTAGRTLFAASGPGWRVQQGQALWRPRSGMPELGGDLVFATDAAGRAVIQFAKTPMALVSAQTTSNRWLIDFPPRNLGFSGRGGPPARFAWLSLPAGLAGKALVPPLRFERKPDGGWRLENTRSGEAIEGFLAQ
jgi:hypothetical protein